MSVLQNDTQAAVLLQVRLGQLREGGHVMTRLLHAHVWRAHKLAFVPEQPSCFYSCAEDGHVVHYGA